MRYKEYVRIRELLSLVTQAFETLECDFSSDDIMGHVSNSLALVKTVLEQESSPPIETICKIGDLQERLRGFESGVERPDSFLQLCGEIESSFDVEVEPQLKIVFFPYKAAMWDSLESIYFAALKDEACDVEVVPIPYYELSENGAKPCYEGDLFPPNIPITHYSAYNLQVEHPDIVFVHNIYDQHNTLTRVHEDYFTSNLRKHTAMLVYVPYCLFSFVPGTPAEYIAYRLPGIANVDRVVLLSEHLKEKALTAGVPADKLLVLGSPKLDKMVRVMEEGVAYPHGWREKMDGKTVFLLDTHLLFLATEKPFEQLETLVKLLNIPNIVNNSVLIWRPHPLFKSGIAKYNPYLKDYFTDLMERRIGSGEYANVILDDSPDYFPALLAADVYVGGFSSLMYAYLATGKTVVLLADRIPENSLVSGDAFRYFYDNTGARMDLLCKVVADCDISRDSRRQSALEGVYVNIDGSSGRKIHMTVKRQILQKMETEERI